MLIERGGYRRGRPAAGLAAALCAIAAGALGARPGTIDCWLQHAMRRTWSRERSLLASLTLILAFVTHDYSLALCGRALLSRRCLPNHCGRLLQRPAGLASVLGAGAQHLFGQSSSTLCFTRLRYLIGYAMRCSWA